MKKFKQFITILFFAIGLMACKEESLSPNEDAAKIQQAGIDIINAGGNFGGGSGGGNGGGGAAVDEYFSAEVDGVLKTNPNPTYQSGLGMKQVGSNPLNGMDIFLISINGALEVKTVDNPIIGYFANPSNAYQSINGKLILESVTTDLLQGTFYFDAVNSSTNDTVSVTNGRFKVEL